MSSAGLLPYSTTLLVRDHCVCLQVQRAARSLARRFDDAFRPLGLTNRQFSLLMSLHRPKPPSMGPVANLLAMNRTTLTAALKPLERRGLVCVQRDQNDRRNRTLLLTPKGRDLLTRATPIWESTHAEIERHVTEAKLGELRDGLMAIT